MSRQEYASIPLCPKCGGPIEVLPDIEDGAVLARCRLTECGHRWRSQEQRIIDLGYMAYVLGGPDGPGVQP
jgi:hypothetical protein